MWNWWWIPLERKVLANLMERKFLANLVDLVDWGSIFMITLVIKSRQNQCYHLKYQALRLLEHLVLRHLIRRFPRVRFSLLASPHNSLVPISSQKSTIMHAHWLFNLTDPPITARNPLVIRESFTRNFTFPGTSEPEEIVSSEEILGQLLEKTLREQSDALCPSPTSSRKSSVRVNTPKTNRQISASKPIVTSGAFGVRSYTAPLNIPSPSSSPSPVPTPTRGQKLGITTTLPHSRVLSLRSPNSTESEGTDYFNSKISEENSGFTPLALKESNNSKLYRIPSSPTIAKRSARNKQAKPQRGSLYFTETERQKIEELVAQSKNRNCTNHQNCTDCIEKEYAYFENKIMSTSMPPERRQQIMKANRSIRNIKNVRSTLYLYP